MSLAYSEYTFGLAERLRPRLRLVRQPVLDFVRNRQTQEHVAISPCGRIAYKIIERKMGVRTFYTAEYIEVCRSLQRAKQACDEHYAWWRARGGGR